MTKNENIIEKAKRYYFEEWRGHEKLCPAFGEKVLVTRLGWEHTVHHPRHDIADVIRRLKNLDKARELLEMMPIIQDKRETKDYIYYAFKGIIDDTTLKVIVSSPKKTGKKYFFSVMVRTTKKGSVSPL